jgi:hypothetical protein
MLSRKKIISEHFFKIDEMRKINSNLIYARQVISKYYFKEIAPWLIEATHDPRYQQKALLLKSKVENKIHFCQTTHEIIELVDSAIQELNKLIPNEKKWTNPISVPKYLYRWLSTEAAKSAIKNGIKYSLREEQQGGIPTLTLAIDGEQARQSAGANNVSKQIRITTAKVPNFKFREVPTRTNLLEIKVCCDIPAEAIEMW